MEQTTTACPACGAQASGRFCSECGTPLTGMRCPGCAAELSAGARFCHVCGTPLGKRESALASGAKTGWIAAGAVSVALVVVLASRFGGSGPPPPPAPPVQARAPSQAMDISSMSPRQRADRLFDRIMIASEGGFADSVAFFTPMALQAYELLGPPDVDARYHLGLIHALANDADAVQAQLDGLRADAPDHLFASMLQYTLGEMNEDQDAVAGAYRAFLAAYESEIGSGREEYRLHQRALDAFRSEAVAATGAAIQPEDR